MPFRGFSPQQMDARCQGRMLDRRIELVSDFLSAQKLPPSANILEIGSGTGLSLQRIARNFPKLNFHGVEPVTEYVAYANKNHTTPSGHIKFSEGSAEALQLPDASFDAVYSVNVWHHIPLQELLNAAQTLARLLKPGGRYFAIEPNWLNPYIAAYQALTPDERNFLPWRELRSLEKTFKRIKKDHHFIFPEACRNIPEVFQYVELSLEYCPLLAGSVALTFMKR
jgi:ubiquinone/menaquinone biosynthesis C-methylase UbiE